MPTMANITVKKFDGTTDVVYTAVQASAGNEPAKFRNDTVGTTLAQRPTLLVSARDNGPKTARRVNVEFSWPMTSQDAGGNVVVSGRMTGSASVLIPQNQDPLVIREQAYQFGNLMAATLIKQSLNEGFAPT